MVLLKRINMKERIIRTNNRCQKCDGFLIFEVKESDQDKNGNKIIWGTWLCTVCEGKESGLLVSYEEITKKKEVTIL